MFENTVKYCTGMRVYFHAAEGRVMCEHCDPRLMTRHMAWIEGDVKVYVEFMDEKNPYKAYTVMEGRMAANHNVTDNAKQRDRLKIRIPNPHGGDIEPQRGRIFVACFACQRAQSERHKL